ncbi:MAG TPA: hypothetical protein VGC95_09350, partial [Chitinophagaceae bacterium]
RLPGKSAVLVQAEAKVPQMEGRLSHQHPLKTGLPLHLCKMIATQKVLAASTSNTNLQTQYNERLPI